MRSETTETTPTTTWESSFHQLTRGQQELFTLLLTNPDAWPFSLTYLVKHKPDKNESIQSAIIRFILGVDS